MRSKFDRTRGELESALKRVALDYARGNIQKSQLDEFSNDMEHAFQLIDEMEEDQNGQTERDPAVG